MEAEWVLAGRRVRVKNLEKVFFPDAGITKGDLLAYYRKAARWMLPHLNGRPLTLYQCPDGLLGKCFFRRKLPEHAPEWFPRVLHNPKTKTGSVPLILVEDEAHLIWLANQAAVEFHTWNARVGKLDHPDRLVLDLDPGEVAFERVLEAALTLRAELERRGLASWPKTSGGRGLHLLVPLVPEYTHAELRAWARTLAEELEERYGWIRRPKGRSHVGTGVQLDYAQNGYGRNTAAPYTVRARPGAPVSTPLRWEEIERGGITPETFTPAVVLERLRIQGDPMAGMLATEQRLPAT